MYIFNLRSTSMSWNFHGWWCSKNSYSIVIACAESVLHVLETSFQAVRGNGMRVVGLNEALQPWNDLVVWDREGVDVEAEKTS